MESQQSAPGAPKSALGPGRLIHRGVRLGCPGKALGRPWELWNRRRAFLVRPGAPWALGGANSPW
eukprot:7718875-Pyramimonas_sp.AAC.1